MSTASELKNWAVEHLRAGTLTEDDLVRVLGDIYDLGTQKGLDFGDVIAKTALSRQGKERVATRHGKSTTFQRDVLDPFVAANAKLSNEDLAEKFLRLNSNCTVTYGTLAKKWIPAAKSRLGIRR
jgi:hypothetical protein